MNIPWYSFSKTSMYIHFCNKYIKLVKLCWNKSYIISPWYYLLWHLNPCGESVKRYTSGYLVCFKIYECLFCVSIRTIIKFFLSFSVIFCNKKVQNWTFAVSDSDLSSNALLSCIWPVNDCAGISILESRECVSLIDRP